jgi:hypothetical protein
LIYPDRFVRRDIAEADRAALGTAAEHRILVLVQDPENAAPLVEVGAALAVSREHSELVLSHLVAHNHDARLEVGAGLGSELVEMTGTMGELQALADWASTRGVSSIVQSRFSEDIAAELPGYAAAAEPDTILLGPVGHSHRMLAADGAVQLVTSCAVCRKAQGGRGPVDAGEGGAAAVQVAVLLAVADRLQLVISPGGCRRAGLAA